MYVKSLKYILWKKLKVYESISSLAKQVMEKKCLYVRRQRAKTEGGEESTYWIPQTLTALILKTAQRFSDSKVGKQVGQKTQDSNNNSS